MTNAAIYRRYAEECQRLAWKGSAEDRTILLEHAAIWATLAEAAEREASTEGEE